MMKSNDVIRRFLVSVSLAIAASFWIAACSSESEESNVRTTQQRLTGGPWLEGSTYEQGDRVTYNGAVYEALQTHTATVGGNWNPEAATSLWSYVGVDDGQPEPGSTGGSTGMAGSVSLGNDIDRVFGFVSAHRKAPNFDHGMRMIACERSG